MMNAYELSLHGVGISIYPASISPDPRQGRLRAAGGASECPCGLCFDLNKNHTLSHVAEEFIKYVESIEERNSVE